jgi:hypothetical protein
MAITQGKSTMVGSGSDTLVLKVTQNAYQGDAQYVVYVDGKQVGGTLTAQALRGSGQSDTVEIKGDWATGNHNVSVKFLNDLYHGSPTTDRNLYVESATYNGAAVPGSKLDLYSNTAQRLHCHRYGYCHRAHTNPRCCSGSRPYAGRPH